MRHHQLRLSTLLTERETNQKGAEPSRIGRAQWTKWQKRGAKPEDEAGPPPPRRRATVPPSAQLQRLAVTSIPPHIHLNILYVLQVIQSSMSESHWRLGERIVRTVLLDRAVLVPSAALLGPRLLSVDDACQIHAFAHTWPTSLQTTEAQDQSHRAIGRGADEREKGQSPCPINPGVPDTSCMPWLAPALPTNWTYDMEGLHFQPGRTAATGGQSVMA